jgi:hypothetical protein
MKMEFFIARIVRDLRLAAVSVQVAKLSKATGFARSKYARDSFRTKSANSKPVSVET